jgi:hypothetical protein
MTTTITLNGRTQEVRAAAGLYFVPKIRSPASPRPGTM